MAMLHGHQQWQLRRIWGEYWKDQGQVGLWNIWAKRNSSSEEKGKGRKISWRWWKVGKWIMGGGESQLRGQREEKVLERWWWCLKEICQILALVAAGARRQVRVGAKRTKVSWISRIGPAFISTEVGEVRKRKQWEDQGLMGWYSGFFLTLTLFLAL